MTSKSFKRLGVLLLACILLVVSSTTAFATSTNIVSVTGKADISAGQTATVYIQTLGEDSRLKVKIETSGFHLFGNPTISWGIHKQGEPNFMSGETIVGDTFSSSGYYNLSKGAYYAEITNNSSFTVTVNVSFVY